MTTLQSLTDRHIILDSNKKTAGINKKYQFLNFNAGPGAVDSNVVGCFAPEEYSSGLTMTPIDNNLYTKELCALNAGLMNSNIRFSEEQELNKESSQKINGLYYKIVDGYFADNVNYFNDSTFLTSGQSTDLSSWQSASNNYTAKTKSFSVEWVGYFKPNKTGNWTFTMSSSDSSLLWIGEIAVSTYKHTSFTTQTTGVLNNSGIHTTSTDKSLSISLLKDKYYPIRIQYGKNTEGSAAFSLSLKGPGDTTSIQKLTDFLYTMMNSDNTPKMPSQIYYSLVRDSSVGQDTNGASDKFKCYTTNQISTTSNIIFKTLWSSSLAADKLNSTNYATMTGDGILAIKNGTNDSLIQSIVSNNASGTIGTLSTIYKLKLLDGGLLKIYRINGGIESELSVINPTSESSAIVNEKWKIDKISNNINDYIMGPSSADAIDNDRITNATNTSTNHRYIISSDYKYKLEMDKVGNLIIKYGVSGCKSSNYTDSSDLTNNAYQLYELTPSANNLPSYDKLNKTFYSVMNSTLTDDGSSNTLQYIPSDSSILKYSNTYVPVGTNVYYEPESAVISVLDNSACSSACSANANCKYYYYDNTAKKCQINTTGNLPTRFTPIQPNSLYQNSQLYIRQFDISLNSSMMPAPIDIANINTYSEYGNYDNYLISSTDFTPKKVGFYSEPDSVTWAQDQQNKLIGSTNVTTESFKSFREGYGGGVIQELTDKINGQFIPSANSYSTAQTQVGEKYIDLCGNILVHNLKRRELLEAEGNKYDFKGDVLNYKLPKKSTMGEGIQEDINIMMVQQNTMYIVGAITAATLLVSALFIGRSSS